MTAQVVTTLAGIREQLVLARRQARTIACVPTMGALHAGHGALIEQARAASDVVVVTLFVNPFQFDQKADFERYARRLDEDRRFCEARNVDFLFAPSAEEMYPRPPATLVEAPELSRHLCGAFRPGHFRGVATVVAKLFNIIQPDTAYFGEKDAQQLAVIRRMVLDLNFPVRIIPVPTVREPDGLALSSRNLQLTTGQRRAAPVVFRALNEGLSRITAGERRASAVKEAVLAALADEPCAKVEYVDTVDGDMQPVDEIGPGVLLAAAVWIGGVRLIDNLVVR